MLCRCPRAQCDRLFLGVYVIGNDNVGRWRLSEPEYFVEREFPASISKVSPDFVKIFNHAAEAESEKLDLVCGPGYRKALEFLMKDYLVNERKVSKSEVEQKLLGRCIDEFIADTRIKESAKRAAWLGNDETHYYRKWQDRDLGDLKNLIQMTVDWIDIDIRTKEIISAMPPKP